MTQHSSYLRNVFLSTVFAVSSVACSGPAPSAQEIINEPPSSPAVQTVYSLPAAVQNFYMDGQAAQRCATIDGQGTTSPIVADSVREISTTLNRFPLGHAAVLDLKKSGTVLCFESGPIADNVQGVVRHAEYLRERNMFRVTDADPWQVMHEWKHKKDDINFNNFFYTPRSAVLMLRFSEAGAYTFEAMARHEAQTYGVSVPPYPAGSHINQVERAYAATLGRGGTKEQAWRAAFDTTFNIGMLSGYTDHVLGAYQQAVTFAPISQNPNFAKTVVSDEALIKVALPPGWGVEAFRRTGNSEVTKDLTYVGNNLSQEEQLQNLERTLEKKPEPAPAVLPSPVN